MVLKADNIFPTVSNSSDEFFESEAEQALRTKFALKTGDQSTSEEVLYINDTQLFFDNIQSDSVYNFEIFVFVDDTENGTDGTVSVPAGAEGRIWITVDEGDEFTTFQPATLGTGVSNFGTSNFDRWSVLKGWVKTAENAGTIGYAMRSGINGTIRIKAGSWMTIQKQ